MLENTGLFHHLFCGLKFLRVHCLIQIEAALALCCIPIHLLVFICDLPIPILRKLGKEEIAE